MRALREIRHQALHDRVYEEIRRGLMAGQFEPGEKVSSRKLASALGTSDMPVRTAMSRLIAEGGLLRGSNGTVCVPTCSRRLYTEGMDLRILLEGHATQLACGHLMETDFAALERYSVVLDEAIQTKDVGRYLDANQNLKFTIYNKCGSQMLLHTLSMLWLKIGPFLRRLASGLDQLAAANFHDEAICALRRGAAEAAAAAIRRDLTAGRDLLLATARFQDDPVLEAAPRNINPCPAIPLVHNGVTP
jgi:DNA-binding GntR family transcriptional regulator